jgi:hypothetical protein
VGRTSFIDKLLGQELAISNLPAGLEAEEVQMFEAVACLRWLLLNRIAEVPKNEKTIERFQVIFLNKKRTNRQLSLAVKFIRKTEGL